MVVGGALVIPQGLLNAGTGGTSSFAHDEEAKRRIERIAMDAVLAHETSLGHMTRDVSAEKCGWDVTATPPPIEGRLSDSRLIEVKGRVRGATSVTVTRNEVMCCLNKPEQFYLAIVTVDEDGTFEGPYYLRRPFTRELDWSVTSVNLDLDALIARAESQARAEA